MAPTEHLPPEPTPVEALAPPPTPMILISEFLTGIEGNNNFEYIELYNTGDKEPLDLIGASLWFKLGEGQDEILVYSWAEHALVPPLGHYLLVREDEDVGSVSDAVFDISMIPQRGSLQLRLENDTVSDSVAWGSGPGEFAEGSPADALSGDLAFERKPGGGEGNWSDSNDNAADFLFSRPSPQGVGSFQTPDPNTELSLTVDAPTEVDPGAAFEYNIMVKNNASKPAHHLTVQLPIVGDLEIVEVSDAIEMQPDAMFWGLGEMSEVAQFALWEIGSLESGDTASATIKVRAPWTYTDVVLNNYSAQADNLSSPTFGSPVRVSVEGGTIPIGVLRDVIGEEVVIEGTATMYTGGYYAGTGNVKFYLEDESGGVQVWVPEGEGEVNVGIGSDVRVLGNLTVYRGALELVVNDLANVEFVSDPGDPKVPEPTQLSIKDAANDPEAAGKLVQVEGVVTRNEEFSYSYEVDIIDETGQMITLYIDKQTNINVELVESGQHYQATGILEIRDTRQQIYPRVQADLERIYPPVLTLEMDAPITVLTGEDLKISLTAINYMPDLVSDLIITATLPRRGGVQFITASDGHEINGSTIYWHIPRLEGGGSQITVDYEVSVISEDEYLAFEDYTATAREWPEPTGGTPYLVFIGDSVPVWAIQGFSDRSPYILKPVSTEGVVTGVFPELGGFWIQEKDTDSDPRTSSGLFINTGELEIPVGAGKSVQVNGIVRETIQQTQVQVSSIDDIVVLENGGPLPLPVDLNPPAAETEAITYYESLEGMLVQVEEKGVVVGPTSRYGEFVLVRSSNGVERLWQGDEEHNGLAIMVDDGDSVVHENQSTLDFAVNTGDVIQDLIGPLAYTFGRFKIEPIVKPSISAASKDIHTLDPIGPGEFRMMSWNVENLFDVLDPHPSSPEKPAIHEYKVSIAKVANTILAAGAPTIIGLQEVENIDILEDIAGHENLADFQYRSILVEGTDSRFIDVGYLVRGDTAEVLSFSQHIAPEGLTSRPPLEIEIQVQTEAEPIRLFVLNNHFSSMSGGVSVTEPRRNAQAAWNVTVMKMILEENPEAYIAVIGDLNSFYDSVPIDTLREAGLIHVFQINPEHGWYSYIFEGSSQNLDHILVTPNLFDLISQVDVLHVNADFTLPAVGDESPLGKSDHDPVVATFSP